MSINCEKYKAKIPEKTCFSRQKAIFEVRGLNGRSDHFAVKNMNYSRYQGCEGCEIGLKIFELFSGKKGGIVDTKSKKTTKLCADCGKLKPADKDHFYAQAKAPDGLQKACKVCFNAKYAPAKKPKITGNNDAKPTGTGNVHPPVKQNNENVETRTCGNCTRELELTVKNFHRRKSNAKGFSTQCKDCENKRKRQLSRRPEKCIVLDLTDSPGLMSKIEAWAKKERRPPDQQILFFIENCKEVAA